MAKNTKNIKKETEKNYLAKDYDSFKQELASYAKTYFSSKNSDFSEASLGGMFVDLAAYVGDSMSFFLDHQFNELNPFTATEAGNILAHAKNAGVKITGAAPASADVDIFIEVPATTINGRYAPHSITLPIILEGTTFKSSSGITFTTTEDLDFSERDVNGEYTCSKTVSQIDSAGNPIYFILTKSISVTSGKLNVESVAIGAHSGFKKITLSKTNVTEIISVVDADENVYYEVDYLTQNTVFKKTKNIKSDQFEVPAVLEIVNAGRRFILQTNYNTMLTTMTFGSGDPELNDNDIIPDPSELALPLYGRTTFQRFSIDPNNLLRSKTLGISPVNTTLIITYRSGGGLSHNVPAESIKFVDNVRIEFPNGAPSIISSTVVNSIDVKNKKEAAGGMRRPNLAELRSQIFSSRNEQSRIVTNDDLLARLYTLPSQFGRVFRASVRKSSRNPLASEMYIICQDRTGNLTIAPDTLKRNISVYLNEFRLISDAIDVLDTTIINYGVEYSVVVTPESNKSIVSSMVARSIISLTNINSYQIDQPLIEADFINAIINTPGVLSLQDFTFFNKSGNVSGKEYSSYNYDLQSNKFKGMIVGPPGSIFELKYSTFDIIGSAE
ncbi:MAG: hypothetical protein H8E12_13035 [Rhodobacteraceae bacterium]|nr:hypothetical protein [Paracoccaceae bacterium]